MIKCVHFIGFKDESFYRAVKVFGYPDYIHRHWDGRAQSMIIDGDIAVFARGDEDDVPQMYSFDDSGVM